MAYPNYPASSKSDPHWTYTDKQLFARDGHIVRPLEYVDAYSPTKQWTFFDFKAQHGFGGTVGLDAADKILWIPNGSILRDIYDLKIDPRYTVLVAGIPKPILDRSPVSTADWFKTLRSLFGVGNPPGGWNASGKWDSSLNPTTPTITNGKKMAAATPPTLSGLAAEQDKINGLLDSIGLKLDGTNQAANTAAAAAIQAKDVTTAAAQNTNSGPSSQTLLLIGGALVAAYFLFKH